MDNLFYLNKHALLPLFSSLSTLFLGILVYIKNDNKELKRIFLLLNISLFLWPFSYSITFSSRNYEIALFFIRLGCSFAFLCSPLIYHLILTLLNIRSKERLLLYASYLPMILAFLLMFFTDKMLANLKMHYFGYYSQAGPYYIYFIIIFYLLFIRPFYLLIKSASDKDLDPRIRLQSKYFLLGLIFAYIGSIDYLIKYGFNLYPLGAIFVLIWTAIMSYAILKHNLLDINLVFKKGLVYSVLIVCLTILYLLLVLILEKFFQNFFGYQSIIISIIYAIIIALTFTPIKNKIQSLIDRYFFKGSQQELALENERLRAEVNQTEKFKAISTLASGMAHEIKNPLTAIKTFSEHLPEKWNDPVFREKFTRIIGTEVDRIDNIVHQLLEFAKPSPLKLSDIDICKLIEDTLAFLSSDLVKNKISLKTEFLNRPIIKADSTQMRQALLNFFLNAIEAMPEGGELNINVEGIGHREQGIVTSNPKPYTPHPIPFIIISISDSGHGIPQDQLKNLFTPFQTTKQDGIGLGLSITKEIIDQHGGTIEVESRVHEGTTFTIKLPKG